MSDTEPEDLARDKAVGEMLNAAKKTNTPSVDMNKDMLKGAKMTDTESVDQKKRIRIRAGHRAHLTRLMNSISSICTSDYNETRSFELLASKGSLETKGDTLRRLDADIINDIEDEEVLFEEIDNCERIQMQINIKLLEVDSFIMSALR